MITVNSQTERIRVLEAAARKVTEEWYSSGDSFEEVISDLRRLLTVETGAGAATFCRACGASIPHRPGEGRCPECIQYLTDKRPHQ